MYGGRERSLARVNQSRAEARKASVSLAFDEATDPVTAMR